MINGRIKSIRKIENNDDFVYNIEVDADKSENKNYFANNLLVSNCHSLSGPGTEALLKIIEEPPPHVVFVLATTEFHKMPSTIVSRCQSHEFQKVYWTQIVQRLSEISKLEKIDIDEQSLKLCAILASGSVRDAIQYLNKLISYGANQSITVELSRKLFGVVNDDVYYKIMSCIVGENGKPNASEGYRLINDILISGVNTKSFLQGLDEHLRHLFIALTSPKTIEKLVVTDEEKKKISIEASRFDIPKINQMMNYLSEIYRCMNYGINPERLLDQWFANSVLFCHLGKAKEKNVKCQSVP